MIFVQRHRNLVHQPCIILSTHLRFQPVTKLVQIMWSVLFLIFQVVEHGLLCEAVFAIPNASNQLLSCGDSLIVGCQIRLLEERRLALGDKAPH